MTTIDFASFDPTTYQRVPIVNTKTLVGLARALLDAKPPQLPAWAEKAADRVAALVTTIEDELTERHRDQSSAVYGNPNGFDSAVDALWVTLRDRLAAWSAYANAGFDVLVAQPHSPAGALVVRGRDHARQAAILLERLFGGDGLMFVRAPAPEQYESAGAILRLIEADGLRPQLEALVQPELVGLLYATHAMYGTMVLDRLANERDTSKDLRELRNRLSRAITRYAIAVLALADEDIPTSLATVDAALRPIRIVRDLAASRARKGDSADADGYVDDEPDEPDADDSDFDHGLDLADPVLLPVDAETFASE